MNANLQIREITEIIVAGELHNSSASTFGSIKKSFRRAKDMGVSTVLAPVAWQDVEPEEGVFDFTLLQEMVRICLDLELKLVPLWFGSYKNGASAYVPNWVKENTQRFPRSKSESRDLEHLSVFGEQSWLADAKAFTQLVREVNRLNKGVNTMPMIQVENEAGLLGSSRDKSQMGLEAWNSPLPDSVIDALHSEAPLRIRQHWLDKGQPTSVSWSELFGEDNKDGDDAFMAWGTASFIERVAKEGRELTDLPFFVNAWLPSVTNDGEVFASGGVEPGGFPSGGPLPHNAAIWKREAESIQYFTPDIYFDFFSETCENYRNAYGEIMVPELGADLNTFANSFASIGSHGVFGISPFGIDSLEVDEDGYMVDGLGALNAYAKELRLAQMEKRIHGFVLHKKLPVTEVIFGETKFEVRVHKPYGSEVGENKGYGIVFQREDGSFVWLGRGFIADVGSNTLGKQVGILRVKELAQKNGALEVQRNLNGDETRGDAVVHLPLNFDRRRQPAIGCETGMSELEIYMY